MKKKILILCAFFTILFFIGSQLMGFGQKLDAKVIKKEELLEQKLKMKGLKVDFIRISGKRSKWFNELLSLSTKNSLHLSGKAIDILVGDINGDKKQDETDIKLVVACLEEIEKEHPTLVGGIGTYLNQGAWSRKMVHFDVRGYKARWNK